MSLSRIVLTMLALAGLSACTTTTPIAGQTIDETYSVGGYTWNSGPAVYVHYKMMENDGHVAICGVWSVVGGQVSNADVGAGLGVGVLYLGGARIKQGVDFLNQIDNPRNAKGKPATCRRTSVKWRAEFDRADPKLTFPAMRFY